MSEEEKKLVEKFKNLYIKDFNGEPITVDDRLSYIECALITNLIEKLDKKLNNLKEIEKSHQEENGKLRVELEQEKEKYKRLQNTEAFSECYISKDKIKNILDKFNKGEYHYIHDLMQEIQELLEEKQNVRL